MDKRFRFKFTKRGEHKYLSHLDIINIILRALRRAGIKIKYSEGFNPKPRITFSPPIPLGIKSLAEYADVTVTHKMKEKEFLSALNRQLEGRITISDAREVPPGVKNLMSQVDIAEYLVRITGSGAEGKPAREYAEKCLKDLKMTDAMHSIENIKPMGDKKHILLRLYTYVRTLTGRNEKVFKLKDFLGCFRDVLAKQKMKIDSLVKEELFILEDDKKLTPFEVL
jgi:radical SAM-linked protein